MGGSYSRLFHSRRIGLVEGQPIRLLGGARLVVRAGGTDIGLLNMQTAAALGRPSENFGVARLRQRVFNEYSTVGGMVTSRVGTDGSYNVAAGVDALVRLVGDEYATLKFAHTSENGAVGTDLLDASRMLFRWERRAEGGISYAAEVARSGAAFNPGIGFDLRSDFTSFYGGHRVALTATPAWNPSPHLEMGADYSFNAIRFPARDLALDVHLGESHTIPISPSARSGSTPAWRTWRA